MQFYENDRPNSGNPQQNLDYKQAAIPARLDQWQVQVAREQRSLQQKPEKMPKARALALARTLKRWLAVASLVGFGTISGLAAFHQVGVTTTASQASKTSSSWTQPTNRSLSPQDSGSFFNQEGNNFGTGSSSQPSSGSSVS